MPPNIPAAPPTGKGNPPPAPPGDALVYAGQAVASWWPELANVTLGEVIAAWAERPRDRREGVILREPNPNWDDPYRALLRASADDRFKGKQRVAA